MYWEAMIGVVVLAFVENGEKYKKSKKFKFWYVISPNRATVDNQIFWHQFQWTHFYV